MESVLIGDGFHAAFLCKYCCGGMYKDGYFSVTNKHIYDRIGFYNGKRKEKV